MVFVYIYAPLQGGGGGGGQKKVTGFNKKVITFKRNEFLIANINKKERPLELSDASKWNRNWKTDVKGLNLSWLVKIFTKKIKIKKIILYI